MLSYDWAEVSETPGTHKPPISAEAFVLQWACHQHPSRQLITLSPHSVSVCASLQGPLEVRAYSRPCSVTRVCFTHPCSVTHVRFTYPCSFTCVHFTHPCSVTCVQFPWTSLSLAFSSRFFIRLLFVPPVSLFQATEKREHLPLSAPHTRCPAWGTRAFPLSELQSTGQWGLPGTIRPIIVSRWE